MGGSPEFLAARPERRWTGPLNRLRAKLAAEAARNESRSSWKVLPNGAYVSLRIMGDAGLRIQIARRRAPETEDKLRAWNRELAIFVRDLRLDGWTRVDEPAGHDGRAIAAIYYEPARPGPAPVVDLFGEAPAAPQPPSAIEQGR